MAIGIDLRKCGQTPVKSLVGKLFCGRKQVMGGQVNKYKRSRTEDLNDKKS